MRNKFKGQGGQTVEFMQHNNLVKFLPTLLKLLPNKVLKDQGIAKLQIKYNRQNIDSYVSQDNQKGLNIKTMNISIEILAQPVKKNLDKSITETNEKIEKLDELIPIFEEYYKK